MCIRDSYVNAHRIITLLTKHMVDRGETGRVVSTVTASAMLCLLYTSYP